MFVSVEVEEWGPFPGDKKPVPNGLPLKFQAVQVYTENEAKIEAELKEKLYLQFGAVPVKMRYAKKGE